MPEYESEEQQSCRLFLTRTEVPEYNSPCMVDRAAMDEVIWADEFNFYMFGSDGAVHVRRPGG